jgi:hypothetical protein
MSKELEKLSFKIRVYGREDTSLKGLYLVYKRSVAIVNCTILDTKCETAHAPSELRSTVFPEGGWTVIGLRLARNWLSKFKIFVFFSVPLGQALSNCGTRTTSGTPVTFQWYTDLVRNNKRVKSKKPFLQQMQLHRKINGALFSLNE